MSPKIRCIFSRPSQNSPTVGTVISEKGTHHHSPLLSLCLWLLKTLTLGISKAILICFPGLIEIHRAILAPLNYGPASICPDKYKVTRSTLLTGDSNSSIWLQNPKTSKPSDSNAPLIHPSRTGGRSKEGILWTGSRQEAQPRSLSPGLNRKERVGVREVGCT